MRLALLSPLPPDPSGIAHYAADWRRAVQAAGVEVLTPLQGQRPINSLEEARRWVAERDWSKVDVVHAELGAGRHGEFLVLSALAALPKRPRLSATVHDPERLLWHPVSDLWRWLDRHLPAPLSKVAAIVADPHTLWAERSLVRRLDGLVVFTQTGATRLAKRMKVSPAKVRVIPLGTQQVPARPLPDVSPLRMLYLGLICRGQGIEDLFDALARLRKAQPDLVDQARLTIAGSASPDAAFGASGSYLDGLRHRAQEQGVGDLIEWEVDVDARDIAPLVLRHHLVVQPQRELVTWSLLGRLCGTSGVLAWAIACGRGIITSNARAFAEEVGHGNGVSYRQGHVVELAAVIEGVLKEPERVRQWAKAAAVLNEQRLWSRVGHGFMGYFDSLLQGARVRRPSALGGPLSGGQL